MRSGRPTWGAERLSAALIPPERGRNGAFSHYFRSIMRSVLGTEPQRNWAHNFGNRRPADSLWYGLNREIAQKRGVFAARARAS
jgi:hypothetical protein